MFQKNECEVELKDKRQRIQAMVKQIGKVEPVFSALERIDATCKEKEIQGYYGRLIDFIECKSENFMPCVDIAAAKKLMSIVVDTMETAQAVLEINKQIKGGVVNIYPLENVGDLKKQARKDLPNEVKPMLDIVKLKDGSDQRVQTLLDHVFGNTVLARSYDDAMRVAQSHNVNCITTDYQVVYGGSFIVKVGHYNKQTQDRFGNYQQLNQLKNSVW